MAIHYSKHVVIDGMEFGVISNTTIVPDILIIGSIGAGDICLFTASEINVAAYQQQVGQPPKILRSDLGDFIVNISRGGGAAHYIIEQLPFYMPPDARVGLFSIVGRNRHISHFIDHLEAQGVSYYILHNPQMPCPKWAGIVLENGWRFWSPRLNDQKPMALYRSDLLPEVLKRSPVTLVSSMPLANLVDLSINAGGVLIGQVFENYISDGQSPSLLASITRILREKCRIINVNERELSVLGRMLDLSPGGEPLDFVQGRVLSLMSNTLFLTGLGSLGLFVGYGENHHLCFPAIKTDRSFSLGAGDSALASSLGMLFQIIREKDFGFPDLVKAMGSFDQADFIRIGRAFIEGGFVGNAIVDAFTPLKIRRELIAMAAGHSQAILPGITADFPQGVNEKGSIKPAGGRQVRSEEYENLMAQAFTASWPEID